MSTNDRTMANRPPPIPRRAPVIAALDVGTSKVVCLIATGDDRGRTRLLGIGHQRSRGIKAGMVIDPDAAEQSVRAAVGQAERMAGVTMEQISLAVSCGRLKSQRFVARARTETGFAGDVDVARVLEGGESYATRGGRTLVQFHTEAWQILVVNILLGVGIGLGYAAMPALIMSAVPANETGAANGLNALMRSLGTSVAAAVVGAVLAQSITEVGGVVGPSEAGFITALWLGLGAAVVCVVIAAFIPKPKDPEHSALPKGTV